MTERLGQGKAEISPLELVSTLKHSSLPTVLIEGKDDAIVFRTLESKYSDRNLSILPVGGRETLLGVYQMRDDTGRQNDLIFICDKDAWCISGIPEDYQSERLILTAGYSIENDVINDGDLQRMLSTTEKAKFLEELALFVHWYALALSRFLRGGQEHIKLHPNAILDDEESRKARVILMEGEHYPRELFERIMNNPTTLVRGKSIFALLMRQLSYTGRSVRHNQHALIENVATLPGPLLKGIFDRVGALLEQGGSRIVSCVALENKVCEFGA